MIETLPTRQEYDGDGVTLTFAVSAFAFFAKSDLRVYLRDEVTGALTLLVLDADYTVAGGEGATGSVTLAVAPTATQQLVLERVTAPTQETDYQNQAQLPHETLEHDFDRAVTRHQELLRELRRAVHFPPGDPLSLSAELPVAEDRANGVFVFDVFGNVSVGLLSLLSPGSIVVGAAGQTLLPLASMAAWRAALAVCHNYFGNENIAMGGVGTRPSPAVFGTGIWQDHLSGRIYADPLSIAWIEMVISQVPFAGLQGPGPFTAGKFQFDTDNRELLWDDGATNVPVRLPFSRGSLGGLLLTRTATTVIVSPGECRTGTAASRSLRNAYNDAAFTKAINATWAAGNGNGGRAAGVALAANTWYHVHLIRKVTGAVDFVLDTSVECVNGLADAAVVSAGFGVGTTYRRVGSVRTDAGSNLRDFVQHGDQFRWVAPFAVASAVNIATATDTNLVLPGVPPGLRVLAHVSLTTSGATTDSLVVSHGGASIGADGTLTVAPLNWIDTVGANRCLSAVVLTDTSQQIKVRMTDATNELRVEVKGFEDYRGRFD